MFRQSSARIGRRGLRRAITSVTAAAVAAVALSACVATAPTTSSTSGGNRPLNVAFTIAPSTIDPASGCTLDDDRLTQVLYSQLVQYGTQKDANGTDEINPTEVKPYFAKSWDVSADGLTYTFDLNTDWVFPSGKPVDAAAVKYSIERVISIAGCGSSIVNDLYTDPDLISSIDAPDAATVVFTLSKPDSAFLLALATGAASIVDPSIVEANGGVVDGTPNEYLASHDAGAGPFTLQSLEPGTKAVLVKNPTFKGEAPASDQINVSWVKTDSTLLLQAKDNTNDVTFGLAKNSASTLGSGDGLKVVASTATANMQMLLPNDKAPWNNEKVREAVTYAIPYTDILSNVLFNYGELYYGPIPPTMAGFSAADSAARSYDVDKAKSLIAESGISTPVAVSLDILSGDTAQASIATILQSSLGQIGIDLTVNTLSESAWGDAVYNGTSQAALRQDGPAVFNPGYYLQYDEQCDSAYNTGHICVPANTELLDQARSALDSATSDGIYAQITKNWVAASPKVILYLDATAVVMSDKVTGYFWSPSTDMRTWATS